MTEDQTRRYSMYIAMQAFLEKSKHITFGLPRFDTFFNPFCDGLREITRVHKLREARKDGFGETRLRLRKLIVNQGADIARRVQAYAIVRNNGEIINAGCYTEATLERASDNLLIQNTRSLIGQCIPILRDLSPYGIERKTLRDLEVIQHDLILILPYQGMKDQNPDLPELKDLFAITDSWLARMDALVAIFNIADSDFFRSYKKNREFEQTPLHSTN